MRKYFGSLVFKSYILCNVWLSESSSYGKSIMFYDCCCCGVVVYEELVAEVVWCEAWWNNSEVLLGMEVVL